MQGELTDITALELCLHLASQDATATVAVSSPRGNGVIALVDGRLVGARAPTPDPVPGSRLGERLVATGRLDPADLWGLVADQAAEPSAPALGQMLAARGLVPADDVRVALQEQLLEALEEMAGWFEGRWHVQPASAVDVDVPVALRVDDAVAELHRRATDRETGLQPGTDSADTLSTGLPTEESDLPASPTTGSPVALADDGWADRRLDAATTVEEPEPWVGWATANPRAAEERARRAAAAQASSPMATSWTPQAPAAAPPTTSPTPAPSPTDPAAPQAPPAEPAAHAAAGSVRPRPPVDADTRRALFSELHEVGRSYPAVAPAPPPSAPADARHTTPPATPEPEPTAPATPPPTPEPAPLSRADVSDLLAELHALNLDD